MFAVSAFLVLSLLAGGKPLAGGWLYTVPGAAHADAYGRDPAEYERRIKNFPDKYMGS
jgi:hypothetical protein